MEITARSSLPFHQQVRKEYCVAKKLGYFAKSRTAYILISFIGIPDQYFRWISNPSPPRNVGIPGFSFCHSFCQAERRDAACDIV